LSPCGHINVGADSTFLAHSNISPICRKPEKLRNHITSCTHIPKNIKALYYLGTATSTPSSSTREAHPNKKAKVQTTLGVVEAPQFKKESQQSEFNIDLCHLIVAMGWSW
jgi:hypothetical protein